MSLHTHLVWVLTNALCPKTIKYAQKILQQKTQTQLYPSATAQQGTAIWGNKKRAICLKYTGTMG